MMQTLSTTIEAKDEYTRGHSYRVAEYAALIAAELGWSSEEIQQLKHAAYLHDIGKIGIPDLILNKPGRIFRQLLPGKPAIFLYHKCKSQGVRPGK